jgi:hypothetical protein
VLPSVSYPAQRRDWSSVRDLNNAHRNERPINGTAAESGRDNHWLRRARIGWLAIVALHLGIFLWSIVPDYSQRIESARDADRLGSFGGWELTPQLYALYGTGITVSTGLVFFIIGTIIFARRSDSWMPLFVSFALVLEGTQSGGILYSLEHVHESLAWLAGVLDAMSSVALVSLFFVFPNGRFVPRWTRWIVVLVVMFAISDAFLNVFDILDGSPVDSLIVLGVVFGSMIYAQIYRYRRVSTLEERQQTKWVMFGMVVAIVAASVAVVGTVANPDRTALVALGWFTILNLGFALIPITIAFAITRYRLFDIDVLINRALVYTIVTVVLGASYTGSVLLLQWVLGSLTGSSGIAVAASTLLAAGLFRPARARVQLRVDRRFYRTRYDTGLTLARFGQSIREEVDLDQLQLELCGVITETMQPQRVTFWISDPMTTRLARR